MKIRSDDKYIEYKIDDHIDKAYSLRTGATVKICKPYEDYKEIRVRRIPITWDMEDVKRIFNAYCVVKHIHEETFRPNYSNRVKTSYSDITTGTYRLRMKIRYDIPSTLIISRYKIEIFYFGQPQTCWRCGMDHRKGDNGGCTTEYKDFINKFSLSDFPPLNETTIVPVTTDEVIASMRPNIDTTEAQMQSAEETTTENTEVLVQPGEVTTTETAEVPIQPGEKITAENTEMLVQPGEETTTGDTVTIMQPSENIVETRDSSSQPNEETINVSKQYVQEPTVPEKTLDLSEDRVGTERWLK